MKQYKLLYFISEDKYFLSHKIDHVINAQNNGFDVLVVCKISNNTNIKNFNKIKVKNFNIKRRSINPLFLLYQIIDLVKIIKEFQPDIIQNTALKPIIIGSLSSLFVGKKINVINCVVGLGYIYINKNLKNLLLKKIINLLFFVLSKKKNYTTVFQNKDDKEYFKKRNLIDSNRTNVIKGSGVNVNFFKPSYNIKKKYDLILHSRMLVDKGIFETIEAIKNLKKKKVFIKVLFLGSPDDDNLANINTKQLLQWVKQKIIYWIPHKENVLEYILSSKISILPSYREGLPKSLLESASCGLPLITSDVPGCREICINNFNGILVRKKKPEDIEKAIEYFFSNKKKIREFGEKSRELVLKNYDVKIISRRFLDLYNNILRKT